MWYTKFLGKNKIVDYLFRQTIRLTLSYRLSKKNNHKYYIICRPHPAGFFSDFFYVLGHIALAKKNNLIPFVDMKNYPFLYQDFPSYGGIENGWEQYFKQGCSIEEAYSDKYILCEEKYPYGLVPYYSTTNLFNEGKPTKRKISELNGLIKEYVPIRDEILNEFKLISDSNDIKNCVGVHIRGTDMKNTPGHNKPETLNQTIERIRKLVDTHNFKKIFLCTDEKNTVEVIKQAFDGVLEVVCLDTYRTVGTEGIHLEKDPIIKRDFHKYNMGYEVLRDAYLLSECKALICGKSNVAYAAMVFNNNNYEWIDCKSK